jgi:alkylated DNA nucleotide flippase Atl1
MEENFFDRVYEVARLVPAGRVTSYGAIANYLGTNVRRVLWAGPCARQAARNRRCPLTA